MSQDILRAINDQIAAIDHKLQRLREEYTLVLENLEKERIELEIAGKVLRRFDPNGFEHSKDRSDNFETTEAVRPTVPEMILLVVRTATGEGLPGLCTKDIESRITERCGQCNYKVIRPTLWRMIRDGRLTKSFDGIYATAMLA